MTLSVEWATLLAHHQLPAKVGLIRLEASAFHLATAIMIRGFAAEVPFWFLDCSRCVVTKHFLTVALSGKSLRALQLEQLPHADGTP